LYITGMDIDTEDGFNQITIQQDSCQMDLRFFFTASVFLTYNHSPKGI
jgi:hypothetical protein